jgi:hypothetical protein
MNSIEKRVSDFIKKPADTARKMGVSVTAVGNWVKRNAIPPKRVIQLANALDVEIHELLPFAQHASEPVKTLRKTREDLDALLAAYEGRECQCSLPESAMRTILTHWGERLPLMVDTLKRLDDKEISIAQAMETLGVARGTLMNLRARYGIAPGPRKAAKKPEGPYKQTTKKARRLAIEVIAGRKTAVGASETGEVSLRTLHRHIEDLLRPQTLNEISHWSRSFRAALAWEVEKGLPRHSVEWRKWAEDRNLALKKKMPKLAVVTNWREATFRRMLIAFLSGEMTLEERALARGGEQSVLMDRFRVELAQMGMDPLKLSYHHQAAVAEIIAAMESHFRTGVSGSATNVAKIETEQKDV